MNIFKWFLWIAVLSFLVFSCDGGSEAQKAECITALDCLEGFQCIDGKCVDPNAGNDEDSAVLPDTGADDKDADSIQSDPDIIDADSPQKDEDVIVTPDPDVADEDNVIPADSDTADTDTVDADASDADVTDIDSDTNDEDNFVPVCGNAVPEEGEECDLGVVLNTGAYGGCKSDCTLAIRCGDGTKNGPELCDSGVNNGSYGFCKSDCSGAGERCGDGSINGPEVCDDGGNNGQYGYCLFNCTGPGLRCGDGSVNGPFGAEECDAGPDNGVVTKCTYGLLSCNVCDGLCKEQTGIPEYCGDSTKNGPESCDDGANNGKYGYCNSSCTGINKCGDLTVQSTEVCDGNTAVCSAIPGMGYNNAATVGCKGTCDAWITDECTCASGYEKDGTQKCTDTNECNDPILNTCDDNADCQNTSGSFSCSCKVNYSGNGYVCTPDTKVNQSCTGLPANASWNTVSSINQTWNGSAWMPSTTGAFNAVSSTTECRFKCNTNFSWSGSACIADIRYDQACTDLPSNAVWNTVSSINQTWSGSAWLPTLNGTYNETGSTTECRYKCASNYHWEGGACISNTRTNQNCSAKPANTDWNTVSSITQTWSGGVWSPSTTSSYNETPSTANCYYKCSADYHWDGGSCVSNTRTNQSCTGLPVNAEWNTVSSITQTWAGSDWTPSTAGVYNTDPSSSDCRYKCKTNYNWSGSACVAATQTANCSAKPANTDWNDSGKNGTYTQTWNGTAWAPVTSTTYNTTPGDCRYVCSSSYHWDSSSCVSNTRTDQACSAKPANTDWNTVSSITQTWSGSAWTPSTTSSYNESASTTECRYKCSSGYHWESSACVSDTRTNQACSAKPANTDWNTVSSITQNWSGSAWTPSTTSSYNEAGSTAECRFKCSSDFYWNSSACVECTDNTHCSDEPGKPYCYTTGNTCAECLVDGNCSVGYVCNSSKQCELNNPCGAGWTYNSSTGRCYKYVSTAASWTAARDACTGQSARLVDISDATENQYVASLIPDGTHIWTGLNDYPVAVSANGGNPTCGTPEAADGTKGSVFYGTTSNASSNIADTCNGSTEDQKEEYFRLVPSAGKNGDWRIKAYQSDSDSFDLAVIVDQNCMTGNSGCSDTAGNCTVESMTINLSNTTYYIYIDSDLHNGDYVIDIIPPASVLPAGIVRAFRWEGLYVSWNNTSFTNFLAGEPNFNSASTSSCDSTKGRYLTVRCVGEQKYSGAANGATWYDDDCTLTKPYVCEK